MPYKDVETRREYYKKNKEIIKAKRKLYREANKDKINSLVKEYRNKNKAKVKQWKKEYYENNKIEVNKSVKKYRENNKEKVAIYRKNYANKYKDRANQLKRDKRKNNPAYKLSYIISNGINRALKQNGYTKRSRSYKILGCSFDEFKQYLENQFESWMNWANHGLYKKDTYNYGWDIDHIIPISLNESEDDVIKLNHYTNLQPLCSKMNRDIKKNNI